MAGDAGLGSCFTPEVGNSAECLQASGDEPAQGREEGMVQGATWREAARLLEQVTGWSPQQGRGHTAGRVRLSRGTLSSQWARVPGAWARGRWEGKRNRKRRVNSEREMGPLVTVTTLATLLRVVSGLSPAACRGAGTNDSQRPTVFEGVKAKTQAGKAIGICRHPDPSGGTGNREAKRLTDRTLGLYGERVEASLPAEEHSRPGCSNGGRL